MTQLTTLNYLSGTRASFTIKDLPVTEFTATTFNIPGISTSNPRQPTPFVDIPLRGDKLFYEPLQVEFIVTEELQNWIEIHDWMTGLTAPNDPDQFKNRKLTYCDGSIIIYSSHNNKILQVDFTGLTPISLSELSFSTEDMETRYLKATAQFNYESFRIVK